MDEPAQDSRQRLAPVSRGAGLLRRAPSAPRDGARPQGRPRGGPRVACGAGRRSARARRADPDRGHRRRRRRAARPRTSSRAGWRPMPGARGGRGFSPTAPRRATWPPAWPSRSAASASSCSAPSTAARSTGWSSRGCAPPSSRRRSTPGWGVAHCVLPSTLDAALAATPGAAAAIVVSPTYFGAVADVRGLARVAHAHGVPLVVDEAWGAHLAFSRALPEHALAAGADLVVSSTHKHAGSLTQSAMLHLGAGAHFDEDGIDHALRLVSSTSPSSLLLASLDAARRHAALHGADLLERAVVELAALRAAHPRRPRPRGPRRAPRRVLRRRGDRPAAGVRGRPGHRASAATRSRAGCATTTTSTSSSAASTSWSRCSGSASPSRGHGAQLVASLARACARAARRRSRPVAVARPSHAPPWGPAAMSPRAAFLATRERVPIAAAEGRIAAECLAAYPPGIPNVIPGERLTGAEPRQPAAHPRERRRRARRRRPDAVGRCSSWRSPSRWR